MPQSPCKRRAQDRETLLRISQDQIQYIIHPTIKYAEGIGTYASYDIEAYDCFERCVIASVFDVTSDRNLALRMVGKFNRYQLDPCHLDDAIRDMLN